MTKDGRGRRDLILDYITEYRHQHGYAPSVGEIAAEIGSVRSNAHYHLLALVKEGRLAYTPHVARSWVVL